MPKSAQLNWEDMEVGCESHFLDSGSFSLWTRAARYAREHKVSKYAFYDTDEFWAYVDDYANFIKKYQVGIDLYANVDVIPDKSVARQDDVAPVLTYRNQRYLEKKHGLQPVPVVHFKEDEEVWLRKYMNRGHELIALGGLVGAPADAAQLWMDRCFTLASGPDHMPRVKLHGFGVTNYDFLIRYPWWSVDSASWTKIGAYGGILVPHRRGGKFCFYHPQTMAPVRPYIIKIALESSRKNKEEGGRRKEGVLFADLHSDREVTGALHYLGLKDHERKVLDLWLEEIGVPLGSVKDGTVVDYGVCSRHSERKAANLFFFERLRKELPEWPWPFRHAARKGLFY